MAELLFYMEKLRGLMKKYHHIVQRYHVQYLAQFDALVLNDTIQVSRARPVVAGSGLRAHVMSTAGPSPAGLSLETFCFHFRRTCMCVRKRSRC